MLQQNDGVKQGREPWDPGVHPERGLHGKPYDDRLLRDLQKNLESEIPHGRAWE